jgi:hypothetical protein
MTIRNAGSAFVLLVVVFALTGCAATTKLPTLVKDPECATSLEGCYYYKDTWTGAKPAVVIDQQGFATAVSGEIVSLDDKGVTLKTPKKGSPDPVETRYELSKVKTVIDENGKIVYGVIPRKFSHAYSLELHLEPAYGSTYSSGSNPYIVRLEPNERFGFCLPGGVYKVSEILFIDKKNNIDRGVDYPILRITVQEGYANYIGDLFLEFRKPEVPDSVRVRTGTSIPYTIVSRPGKQMAAGILGGAILSTAVAASDEERGVIGKRELLIGINDGYKATCKSGLKVNVVEIAK